MCYLICAEEYKKGSTFQGVLLNEKYEYDLLLTAVYTASLILVGLIKHACIP